MKKHLFLKSLLIAIGLLVTSLTTQMWAKVIYLNYDAVTSYLNDGCAKVHAWGGTSAVQDVSVSWVTGNIGSATIADDHDKICFYRYYNSTWNDQTVDVTISDNKNYFFLSSTKDNNKYKISASAYVTRSSYVYFDRSNVAWNNTIQFWLGRNLHTECYDISSSNYVPNTELKYYHVSDWYNYDRYRFVNTTSYSGGSWSMDDGSHNPTNYTGVTKNDWLAENTYNLFTFNGTNGGALNKTEYADWRSLNYTQTVQAYVKEGSNNYALDYSKANITCSSYVMNSATGSTTSSATVSSGTEKEKTFSAAHTAATTLSVGAVTSGYEFIGWYDGSGAPLTTNTSYSHKPTGETTRIAYFAKQYAVTVSADTHGTITNNSGEHSVGQKGISITAAPVDANMWVFKEWQCSDGVEVASTTSATTTVTATAAGTVQAIFQPRYGLVGSRTSSDSDLEGMPGWTTSDAVDFAVTTYTNISSAMLLECELTLYPNREYKFKVYDRKLNASYGSNGGDIGDNTWTFNGSTDTKMKTKGYGTYTIQITAVSSDKPSVSVDYQDSHQVTFGWNTHTLSDAGDVEEEDGGEVRVKTTETISGTPTDFTIESGEYVRDGGDLIISATPNTGYTVPGTYSWYTCDEYDDCYLVGNDEVISNSNQTCTISNVSANRSVYVMFEETTYQVVVHTGDEILIKYVGVKSHPTIEAETPDGMVFERWNIDGTATLADRWSKETQITSATNHGSSIRASFKEPPYLYYSIEPASSWNPSSMYANFYTKAYWGDLGTGYTGDGHLTCIQMEKVDPSNNKLWRCSYNPEASPFAGNKIVAVAFMEQQQSDKANFQGQTGTYRADFQTCSNMFIVSDAITENKNSCFYYNNGYWYNYKEKNSGYYIHSLPGGEVELTGNGDGKYTAQINLDGNTDYYFYLGSCTGYNWSNNSDVIDGNNTTRTLYIYNNLSNNYAHLKTNAGGIYTFSIEPRFNAPQISFTVTYPIEKNDYRAVYNNAASSPTVTRPSNTVKNNVDADSISLWLNKGTNYITFEKCAIDPGTGALSWTSVGAQQTITGVAQAGVYKMELTRDGSTYAVSEPKPYDGKYYIRTNCAPGGWKNYTQNAMTHNGLTYKEGNSSTFDYYFCKYVSESGENVRCVIANDFNIAISDTLKYDDVLDNGRGGGHFETLNGEANIRFSWNSSTNTLKRAYLKGSTEGNDYLNIRPDAAAKIYKTNGTTDLYGVSDVNCKFTDSHNWVYEMNVKAIPNGTAAVTANYNGIRQELIASGTTLIASDNASTTKYPINILYDFKTNYRMASWKPDPLVAVTDQLKNVDMLWVRHGQDASDAINIGVGGSISKVTTVGALQLDYNDFNVLTMNSWGPSSRPYLMYFISFPFKVYVRDVFGLNEAEYGREFVIKKYNGALRAKKGAYELDDHNFWTTLTQDSVMHANEGYCVIFDNDIRPGALYDQVWANKSSGDHIYLYFPTPDTIAAITNANCTTTVAAHQFEKNATFTRNGKTYDHKNTDSHWNLIGMPMFSNAYVNKSIVAEGDTAFSAYYQWNSSDNTWSAATVAGTQFKSMHSYLVQWHGQIVWSKDAPSSIVARRGNEPKTSIVKLELWRDGKEEADDWAFVDMRDGAQRDFALCEDMLKIENEVRPNVYVSAGEYDVAYSQVPIENQIIPVGVLIRQSGNYTFSMPSNFNGTVTLVDNFAQTRTNLAIEDYTVYLDAGRMDDRFHLELDVQKNTTSLEEISGDGSSLKNGGVHKFLKGGQMFIIKNGVVYDAQGNRVR